jgi:hypothetical protein
MTATTTDKVKVLFRLTQDESGYPPYAVEGMWTSRRADGTFEIESIPFQSYEAAVGDVVKAQEVDGELLFQ